MATTITRTGKHDANGHELALSHYSKNVWRVLGLRADGTAAWFIPMTSKAKALAKIEWLTPKPYTRPADVASAAGRDAANRQMREAGRTTWNRDDYNLAAREMGRVLDKLEKGEYCTLPLVVSNGR